MRHDEYVRELLRFRPDRKGERFRRELAYDKSVLIEAALGLAGETGEVVDVVKKHVVYGRDLDRPLLVKEMGDAYNYFSLLAYETGITLEEIRAENIRKLTIRVGESPQYFGTTTGANDE